MEIKKMEKTKFILDVGIVIFGLLAAVFAICGLYYNSKIDYAKKLEEERLKSKIAESNAYAAKAKEEAASALSSAANTNIKAKQLELLVEDQKERAAKAEKELLILKEKVKPRNISANKANELINNLKKFTDKNISLSSSLGDGEAALYANQIKYILETAGWTVNSGIGFSTFTGAGVYILNRTSENKQAKKLKQAFSTIGIDMQEQIMEEMTIQIFVGSKTNIEVNE